MAESIILKPKVKILVAGYERVGKSSLISCFRDGKQKEETGSLDDFATTQTIEPFDMDFQFEKDDMKKEVTLNIWDGGYRDDYCGRLYPLFFPETKVFILCFSVVDMVTFEKCENTFSPMFVKHSNEVPVILVGLKSDLREDAEILRNIQEQGGSTVCYEDGEKLVKRMKWEKYMECSSKQNHNVREVFTEAVTAAFQKMYSKKDGNEKCRIM